MSLINTEAKNSLQLSLFLVFGHQVPSYIQQWVDVLPNSFTVSSLTEVFLLSLMMLDGFEF